MKNNIVIDTNVLIAAVRKGSLPEKALDTARQRYNLVTSQSTTLELFDVANRRKIIERYGVRDLMRMLGEVGEASQVFTHVPRLDPLKADAKDTKFLELAAASGASAIISSDKHLLAMKHFSLKGKPTVQIWTPRQFLDHEQAKKQLQQTRRNMFVRP